MSWPQPDPETTALAEQVIATLRSHQWTIGTAESCTGGLVAAALTAIPGASVAFRGSQVVYHNDLKTQWLAVSPKLLEEHGAVSAAVVEAMAHELREKAGTNVAVAVSGVAGPAAGRQAVGTVWIACVGPGDELAVHKLHAKGDRAAVRAAAVREALVLLRTNLAAAIAAPA